MADRTAKEEASKTKKAAVLKAKLEVQALKAKAEQEAQKIIKAAQKKAQDIIQQAKSAPLASGASENSESGSRQQSALNPMNSILLKPLGAADGTVDDEKLGLAPPMSLDPQLITWGHKLARVADVRHDSFENQHEQDCKGPICGKGGKSVMANAKL